MSFIDGIRGIFCVNRTIKIRFKFKTFKELCLSITTFEITIFQQLFYAILAYVSLRVICQKHAYRSLQPNKQRSS